MTSGSSWPHQFLRFALHTPLTALLLFCVVSRSLEENYPFSHYPMYSDPSDTRPYFSVTDGQGNPIPIATKTGVTAPKIGKIYRKKADDRGKKLGVDDKKLPHAEVQAIGMEMFHYLREEAAERKQTMPDKLQLRRTEISYENGQIVETSEIFAQE